MGGKKSKSSKNKKSKKTAKYKVKIVAKAKPLKPAKTKKYKVKIKLKPDVELVPERKISDIEAKEMAKVEIILTNSAVRQMLIEVGGENALSIIKNFYGNFSDDEIAKKLKLKISDVRATLNRLHSEGLVNYVREKDSETGWYSYSWSLDQKRMGRWAEHHADNCSLKRDEGKEYYICPSCGAASITDFESASECSFKCGRCNKNMEYVDDDKLLQLNEEIRRKF